MIKKYLSLATAIFFGIASIWAVSMQPVIWGSETLGDAPRAVLVMAAIAAAFISFNFGTVYRNQR